MANPSLQRTLAVEGTKAAVSVIGAPIKYIYKWTKAAITGVLGYGKGIFVETFWGFKNGREAMKKEFISSQPERAIANTTFKKGISDILGASKTMLAKNVSSLSKGSAKAIGEVLKGTIYGLVWKPINKLIVEPTKRNIINPTKKWFGDNFSPNIKDNKNSIDKSKSAKIIPIDKSRDISKAA